MAQLFKKIYLALFVVVVLITAAIGYGYMKHHAKNLPTMANNVSAMTQTLVKAGNASACDSVNTVANGVNYMTVCKNNIAWNTAQSNLDISACNGLDNKLRLIADCQNMVISRLVNKTKSLTVCNQFTATTHQSCVDDYWFITASTNNDPNLCLNASTPAIPNCQDSILVSTVSKPGSTPACSLFSKTVQTDCENYIKRNCQVITVPLLEQECQESKKQ